MADNLQAYARAQVLIDSQILAESASVTINRNSQSTPIYTMEHGYVGECAGAAVTELTIEFEVPATGFEFTPVDYSETNKFHNIEIKVGNGNRYLFSAKIYQDNIQYGINGKMTYSINARGRAVVFQ